MSMSFYAANNKDDILSPVYPFSVTNVYLPFDYSDLDAEPLPNPDYNPVLDVNLANGNAQAILSEMGYEVEDGCWGTDDPQEFLSRLKSYSRENEYAARVCDRLIALVELGLTMGATHVYAA